MSVPLAFNTTATQDSNQTNLFSNATRSQITAPVWTYGIVSYDMLMEYRYYYDRVAWLCCVMGTVFSIINLVVYDRQQRKNKKTKREVHVSFVMAVSAGDGIYTLTRVVSKSFAQVLPATHKLVVHMDTFLDVYGLVTFRRCAICMNIVASLERFLTIAFPLGKASYIFKRSPALTIAAVFLTTCFLHSYILFEFTARYRGNGEWYQGYTAAREANEALFLSMKNVVRVLCFYLPVFGALFVNILLMILLKKHAQEKKGMKTSRGGDTGQTNAADDTNKKNNSSNEAKAAKLILALSLTFTLVALPSTVNGTVSAYSSTYGLFKREMYLTSIVNNTMNLNMYLSQFWIFVISVCLSGRFRNACKELLCLLRCRRVTGKQSDVKESLGSSGAVTSQSAALSVSEGN